MKRMLTAISVGLVWLAMAGAAAAAGPLAFYFSEPVAGGTPAVVSPPSAAASGHLSLRVDYLRKEDAVQREDYGRVRVAFDADRRFLHPRAGVEVRMDNSEFLTVWIGEDIRIDDSSWVHLRLNHTRYGEWNSAINFINAYYSFEKSWVRLAIGFGYAALIFDDRDYWNPLVFTSDSPETRFIYEVSFRPSIIRGKLELDLGFRNFDDFEYHGFDDNGYHLEPIFHLSENTTLRYFYERRYGAAFISLPTLSRTTWMVSIEHRF